MVAVTVPVAVLTTATLPGPEMVPSPSLETYAVAPLGVKATASGMGPVVMALVLILVPMSMMVTVSPPTSLTQASVRAGLIAISNGFGPAGMLAVTLPAAGS